jgi:hypothetical protein
MKVKLLKKVRKRFDIIHMPEGFVSWGDRYTYNLYELTDKVRTLYSNVYAQLGRKPNSDKQFCKEKRIFETEAECINYLKSVIIERLRSEGHRGAKDAKIKNKHRKVWYI